MCVYLRTKFQVSSIILPSFRHRVIPSLTAKQAPKNSTQIKAESTFNLTIMKFLSIIFIVSDGCLKTIPRVYL